MKLHFLGTAAYEGIPSLFCSCDICIEAKKRKGKNIRTRTSLLIDSELKIDFPPDTYLHMLRDEIDLDEIKHIVFTHSHSDHFYLEDMLARSAGYAKYNEHIINIYGNDKIISALRSALTGYPVHHYELQQIKPFVSYQVGETTITPLLAQHDPTEECFLFYMEKNNKSLLYGHDSGDFPDSTWAWLANKKLDVAVLECTMGYHEYRATHMNIKAVKETKQRLIRESILKSNSRVVVTHFSHNGRALHEELERVFAEDQIIVAYDGMIIEI